MKKVRRLMLYLCLSNSLGNEIIREIRYRRLTKGHTCRRFSATLFVSAKTIRTDVKWVCLEFFIHPLEYHQNNKQLKLYVRDVQNNLR